MDSLASVGEISGKAISEERSRLLSKAKSGCRGCAQMVIRASDLAMCVVSEKIQPDIADAAISAYSAGCETGGPTFEAATQVQICGNPFFTKEN